MVFLKATNDYISSIMEIYDKAKILMKESGNANQWVNGYPGYDLIQRNIVDGNLYMALDENGDMLGVFYFCIENDPTYAKIYEGNWLNDKPYGVLHRIATTGKVKGFADKVIHWILEHCDNVRVDTHSDNIVMQKILLRNGFKQCGIIYTDNGGERLAYQWVKPGS